MSGFEFQQTPRPNTFSLKACGTCHGDRMVVVGTRKPEQTPWMKDRGIEPKSEPIEEWAPCPDCSAGTDTGFQRYDGSWARTLDPAQVRDRMSR